MPIVSSNFRASGLFKNPHFSTIYSAKIRSVSDVKQHRERLETEDGDFIDIDWSYAKETLSRKNVTKVAVLLHGLEGNAQRTYMLGMAKLLNQKGYDVAALNFRGCSGSKNRLFRSYHSGETEDIRYLINTIIDREEYEQLFIYGVSLGGNAALKYLGEGDVPSVIKAVVTVGVPIDLQVSLEQLNKRENIIYRTSFLVDLRGKFRRKMKKFPDRLTEEDYKKIVDLKTFDDVYTAPAHGFKDALDYYKQASSYAYLPEIKIPTLILNAENDTFLHGHCYPTAFAKMSKTVHLESPLHGGHVGFYKPGDFYYNELRGLEFFEEFKN